MMSDLQIKWHTAMYFKRMVDVTDPCYDVGEGRRMTVPVKCGEYNCYVWKGLDEDEPYRVCGIGIYHKGTFSEKGYLDIPVARKIGTISVDSGLAGFFYDKPNYSDFEWGKLCDELGDDDVYISCKSFFSSSGYGDGCYPVYAYNRDGEVIGLEIRFV